MDLSRAVYSRDLKIAAMRALGAGSTGGEIAEVSTESETAGTLAWDSGPRLQAEGHETLSEELRRSTLK